MKAGLLRKNGGFTLFEVILATGIFVLLAGAVYFSVSSSVQAGAALGDHQMAVRKLAAFEDFLREGFLNLPAGATMALQARDQGHQGGSVELVIRLAPGTFGSELLSSGGSSVVLAALPDGKGRARFCLARFPGRLSDDELNKAMAKAQWLPLMEDVESVRWRFWDAQRNEFVPLWDRGRALPELIEFAYAASGEPQKVSVFRLPALSKSAPSDDGAQPPPQP